MINYLFIGGGNMAKAIIHGMCNSYNKLNDTSNENIKSIYVVDKNFQTHHELNKLGCVTFNHIQDTENVLANIDCIILAVKPQDSINVMHELSELLKSNCKNDLLIISIMAGINIKTITKHLNYPCIRCMPNTPLIVNKGASALVGVNISESQKNIANNMFESSGITCWLEDEEKLHAVTALSGSGPAYVFYLLKAMQDIAVKLDLPIDIARKLISQTFSGAAQMALEIDKDLLDMQKAVMSKGGTTEKAIYSFEENNIAELIADGLIQAYKRSKEIENI